MLGPLSRPMASSLKQGSEDRFAVEARETSDMLRQGDPTVIVGAHGTRMMAYAVPDNQSVVGQFPKVAPEGRFRSTSPMREVSHSDAKIMTDVAPVLFQIADGSMFRIRGHSLARKNPHSWSVVWEGGTQWRCSGGIVEYSFEDTFREILVPEKTPESIVTLPAGWIVLKLEGSQYDPSLYSSHFVPNAGEIVGTENPFHDFSYTLADEAGLSGVSAASVGTFPIAWVGVIDGLPVIFPSYLMAAFAGISCPAPAFIKPNDFCSTVDLNDVFFSGT